MDKVLVITGPTASGKTALSVELASRVNGEIINADSMQIYRKCDIGSAKPSFSERKGITHHLMDIVEPDMSYSAAQYKSDANNCIRDILKRNKLPVITGGTGLYIDALVKNLDFNIDNGSTGYRDYLKELLDDKGTEALYEMLKKRDSNAAASVHMNNTRRVMRYLEILNSFEGSLDEYNKKTRTEPSEYDFDIYVLWPDRQAVYERIEKRVDQMLEAGLVDEVRGILDSGVSREAQSMMGIGYKETISYIKEEIPYEEFIEILKRNTRRYAKRQFTWFKRYENACFINVSNKSELMEAADKIVAQTSI